MDCWRCSAGSADRLLAAGMVRPQDKESSTMNSMIQDLRNAADQLREDATDCWGIRRKLNLRAAAVIMDKAADMLAGVTL